MKKILSLLLILCLFLGALPTQALAYVGDIQPVRSNAVKQTKLSSGSLALQNDYIRVIARKDGTLSTAPATESADPTDRQTPYCYFVTYGSRHTTHPASLRLKSLTFVNKTPNGTAKAIRADYDLTVNLTKLTVSGTTSVYYELVQLKENELSEGSWGVMVSVDNIRINAQDSEAFFQTLNTDVGIFWGYTLSGFTAMGHPKAADSPALKMGRTVFNYDKQTVLSTESSVITGKLENVSTYEGFPQGRDWCYDYITEVYTDGYTWANPFVGLSAYYSHNKSNTIKVYLPDTVSVTPASRPADTRVVCEDSLGLVFENNESYPSSHRYLWGFRDLVVKASEIPTKPDQVDPSIQAKRLAVFAKGNGVVVEPVPNNTALSTLKGRYGADPIGFINGDYESKNGSKFTFTGGAALLSPSVTATWGRGGSLVIHRDGTVEQRGVHLNAPSFKFYQPKSGAESSLKIKLTNKGFSFDIDPAKNDAIIFVDIPYASVKLEQAASDAAGNLIFTGNIGFQTIFNGAAFSLEKLGFGLNEKKEFKVNGVHAKGSFDTAKLMALELAKVEGEVNTFKGEERYAFELELNVFDLFETEAKLALERSKKDGSLIPDELWFFVKSSPGIPIIPPVPVGQLNGGGAGFKDLAATVNGDYFAIPPIKLRGALAGTYLHLIEARGDVVIGPSEISLKASDVGIVGLGKSGQLIDSFGYALNLNGQERSYRNDTYKGIYFSGSEALKLNLPNNTINAIVLDSSVELGAFGGVNGRKDTVFLGVGANAIVKGRVQVPDDIRVIGGIGVDVGNINLVVGGQTTFPIKNVSVSDGMKQAFNNMDVYLGAMVGVNIRLVDTRVWVLIPQIVQTDFKRGEGWDFEIRFLESLPEWNWADHGVEPLVQAALLEENPALLSETPAMLAGAGGTSSAAITVNAGPGETPYIVLAFDNSITEAEIQAALSVTQNGADLPINWLAEDGEMDPAAAINATSIDGMQKTEDDGKEYRLAILRLKDGGTYSVDAGGLTFSDEEGFSVEPFESLVMTQNGYALSGEVKYPAAGTAYVLRTYLGNAKGDAAYLVAEDTLTDPANISLSIPDSGALVPTGEYYVTSFLMTEKTFTLADGSTETALMPVDNQSFDTPLSYTNTNQPDAPVNVDLTFAGNEVMRAAWNAVDDADGYHVTIYQQDGGNWTDTGYGYDLDRNTTSLDMALTVGGNAVQVSESGASSVPAENLSADKTYKVGVRAYRTIEDGKYYSTEAESGGVFLPKYTPLHLSLNVNGVDCEADDNGVYHAYVGGDASLLNVTCAEADSSIRVTRMDTNAPLTPDAWGGFPLPAFTGSLMLRVSGVKGLDVTDVFLLVSVDETPPVLTLSDPFFYADADSGAYTITGTADAGSLILYGRNESVYAGSDGSFEIPGALDGDTNTRVLPLQAQDSAGNLSAPQFALVTRRGTTYTVTVTDDGNGTATASAPISEADMEITLRATPNTGYHFKEWQVVSGGVTITDNRFIMPAGDVTVKAIFEKNTAASEFTVTFDGNGGTPSVGSMTTTGQKLASLPDVSRSGSYRFDGWYTAASGGTKITKATTFSADTTVYAQWTYTGSSQQDTYCLVTATAGDGGTISPFGNVRVREGESLTFTITPDKGYVVSSVKVDGKSVGAVKSYTIMNIREDHTITVVFRKGGSPVSGDSGGLPMWSALLCASAFGLACAAFPRRKRRIG